MRSMKQGIGVASIGLILLLSLSLAHADQTNYGSWWGNVTINGSDASAGVNISAHVNNVSTPTISVLTGSATPPHAILSYQYVLDVLGSSGDEVYFRVDNAPVAQAAQTWVSGDRPRLDLTVNLIQNGSACSYNSSCVSGYCSYDFDGIGAWCVPAGNCANDGTITYANGSTACRGNDLATCRDSVWFNSSCSYACTSGSCGSAPDGGGGGGGGGGAGAGAPAAKSDEAILDDAEDLIDEALEDLTAEGAEDNLDSAADNQEEVVENVQEDVEGLDELNLDEVEDLGLSEDDIQEGQDLLEEAEDLIEQAKDEKALETKADLLQEALEKQQEALDLLPEVREVASDEEIVTIDLEAVEEALEDAESERAKEVLTSMQAAAPADSEEITVTTSLTSYKITNTEETSDYTYFSKITLTITTKKNKKNLVIVATIPKAVAEDISELIFPKGRVPEILQEDPIVAWSFASLDDEDERNITYQVNKKLTSITTDTVATSGVKGVNIPTFFDLVDSIDSYYTTGDISFWDLIDSINKYYGG